MRVSTQASVGEMVRFEVRPATALGVTSCPLASKEMIREHVQTRRTKYRFIQKCEEIADELRVRD